MSENRDQDVVRLLREYREELREQAPSAAVLQRVLAQPRPAKPSAPVLPVSTRWTSRWKWSGLAVAASLLVTVGVGYRHRQAPSQPAMVKMAEAKPAVAEAMPAPPAPETPSVARAKAPAIAPKRVIDPATPPSIRAAMEAGAGPGETEKKPEPTPAPQPAERSAATELAKEESRRAEVDKLAAAPAAPAPRATLHATVLREVRDPGQLARVFTGTYARLADGTERQSPLMPSEAAAISQNTIQPVAPASQQAMPYSSHAPGTSQGGIALPAEQRRLLSPVRDQILEAKKKQAGPQIVQLGIGMVEGFRCTGTRTVDGQRAVERWHSAELGLDLLVRTTEPNGAQVVVRYVNIERR